MRFWRVLVAWTVVVAVVGGIVTAAALADGRTGSASETNDGGAWLLNRSTSSIGHVNRVVGELDSTVGPFRGSFGVSQARNVVVVDDRGAGQAVLIDTNLSSPGAPTTISADTAVHAVPDGVVMYEATSGRFWHAPRDDFGAIGNLEDRAPMVTVGVGAVLSIGLDGTSVLVERDASALTVVAPDGEISSIGLVDAAETDTAGIAVETAVDPVVDATIIGGQVVVLTESHALLVVDGEEVVDHRAGGAVALQQPSPQAPNVIVVNDDQSMSSVDLASGESVGVDGAAADPSIRPIVHRRCVWSLTFEPTVFHFCGRSEPLPGAGSNLALTLVNGWVWVNDVDQGGIWFVQEDDLEVREISDWTAALLLNDEVETDETLDGGDEEIVTDAGADELVDDVDLLDDDDRNEQPVAEDDTVATRRGRAVLVDVLANDNDPDNDPLAVEDLTGVDADGRVASGALVSITADGSRIQVAPPADFIGDISFGYTIHDGREGRDDAQVFLSVTSPEETTNRPPVTEIDNATVRAGRSVALNVVTNDSDPDGDVLVLVDADDLDGAVNFTPDGELSFSPDVASPEGTVDIGYRVSDDFGAESPGTARIRVRAADSNQPPEARNDIGRTSVGKTVVVDVLGNDVDPDGDPLVVQNLQSADGAVTGAQLAPNGQFLLRPEAPGTYRFTYAVSDGPTVDQAQIRITVDPEAENRPPVAVVDEIALAIGESRLVRVLDNDGDPDGDIVGMVDWVGANGLEITEVPGIGFNVLATPSAQPRTEFRYWISDGLSEPVRGTVVVAALTREAVDYPPVAVVDTIDARAGSTTPVYVLRNDYDPEGRFLQIVAPIAQPPEASVRIAPDGQSLLLTVAPDQRFGFQFSYDVADPAGNRASAVVQVRVVPPSQANRAPVASPDVATTQSGRPVVVPVRLNDFDPDGDPITVEGIAEQPGDGSVTIDDDGHIVYTPSDDFTGTDRFVYTLVDGYTPPVDTTLPEDQRGPGRALGEVLVGVMPTSSANRPPIAVDDAGFAPVRIGADPLALDVLANDDDPDGDVILITSVTTPPVGRATVADNGRSVTYSPPADGASRNVSFSYSIADGRGGTALAQISLQLETEPDPIPPIAVDDTAGPVTAGSTLTLDLRINDLDPDGDRSRLVVESDEPALTVLDDGRVEIVAPSETSEIGYRVRDEQGQVSEPAFVTVLVTQNQAPTVSPLSVETEFNTPITIDVDAAVSDPDGDPLVITLGQQRNGGSATVVGANDPTALAVQFTPDTDFSGIANFDYLVDDRNGHSVAGSVTVTVLPPDNREPVATPTSITVEAGVPAVVRIADLVTDPDGSDDHRYSVGSANGPIRLGGPNGRGEVEIGSDVDDGGSNASFEYTVIDGEFSVSATVEVDLVPAAFPPPSLSPDTARVLEGESTGPIPVLQNDVDNSPATLAGAGLTVTSVGVTPNGSTELNGDTITFTPDPRFFGTTSFTYTVQDGRRSTAGESTGTVTVTVVGRPATPQPPTVDSVGSGYLVVGWSAPQGDAARAPVSGYTLRANGSDGTVREQVFTTPTTSFRWDGLTNAVEYCFQVAATNEAGTSDLSAPGGSASCGVPDIRPEAPPAPIVEFGNRQLSLTWSTPLNQGTPIKGYQVRISGGLQDISGELGVTNSYVWTGLDNGTDYTFEVRARNDAIDNDGWSDWSPLSAPEHPLTRPDAPNRPGAQRGDRQVRITWQAPDDGGDPISAYQVQSTIDSRWVTVTPQGVTNTHVWENIPNGTDVAFRVRAINRDPSSTTPGNISPDSPVVRACSVPDAPPRPTVVRGDRQAVVRWTAPNAQGCAISEYRVTSSAGTQVANASATELTYTGLTNGQSYRFTVTAINEVVTVDGVSPNASPPSDAVVPAGRPFVSNVTEATNTGPRRVRVSWTAADDNGAPVTTYQLRVNDSAWIDVGNTLSTTRTEGSDGATYTYRVRAVNAIGPSEQTGAARTVTTWTVPGTPNVRASAGNGWVEGSWSRPANGGTPITGSTAKLSTGSCSSGSIGSRNDPGTSERWNDVNNGTTYRVCVRYRNAVGWSPWGSDTARPTAPPRDVRAWRGDRTGVVTDCDSGDCNYVNADGTYFAPGTTVTTRCFSDYSDGVYRQFGQTRNLTVDSSGTVRLRNACFFGYPGYRVYVTMDGVRSNTLNF